MMDGWIKIPIGIIQKWSPTMLFFWVNLLVLMNKSEVPGTLDTSVAKLSALFGMTPKQVRICVDSLSKGELMGKQRANKGARLIIYNFDSYIGLSANKGQMKGQTKGKQEGNHKENPPYNPSIEINSFYKEKILSNESKKESFPSTANPDNTIPPPPSLESRRKRFYDSLIPFVERYGKSMIRDFYDYWSEADRAAKPRMRFEKEKSWELNRRLGRWARNNSQKPTSRPQPQQQPKPSKLDQYKEVARQLGIYQDGTEQSDNIDEQ